MKDYSRKQYSDLTYRDLMGHKTAKSVWNEVLEKFPEQAEFAMRNGSTPLSRSIAAFIRQSEFKKPYKDNDFVNMEGLWEGPGRGTQYRPGTFDNPYNLQNPVPFIPEEATTTRTFFDAESDSVWCENLSLNINITGTQPIVLVTVTFADAGYEMGTVSGYGTNEVHFHFKPAVGQSGFVTIEASMLSFEGIPGDSNVNLFGSDECCEGHDPAGGFAYRFSSYYSLQRSRIVEPYDTTWSAARGSSDAKTLTLSSQKIGGFDYLEVDSEDRYGCGRLMIGMSLSSLPDIVAGVWIETNLGSNVVLGSGVSLWSSPWTIGPGRPIDVTDYDSFDTPISDNICMPSTDPFGRPVQWKLNEYGLAVVQDALDEGSFFYFMLRDENYDVPNIAPELTYNVNISPVVLGSRIGINSFCPDDYPLYDGIN